MLSNMMKHPVIRISDKTRTAIKADGTHIPVVDAKYSFLVQPEPDDIEGAIPLDPAECMYCRACRRQFGSELVFVTRGLAYVELKNRFGKPELRRFILTQPAKRKVRQFDLPDPQITSEAVIFAAPEGSRTLNSIRAKYRIRVAKMPKKGPRILKSWPPGTPRQAGPALRDKQTGHFNFSMLKHSPTPSIPEDEPPRYLSEIPTNIPRGWVLVHNNVQPTRKLGSRGFRAWIDRPSESLEPCNCDWAPELSQHFRVKL